MALPIDERYLVPPITGNQELRARVWDASDGTCAICGKQLHPIRDFQVDHIIPRCAGGTDDMSNLRASCYRCNRLKCDTQDRAYCRKVNGPRAPHGDPVDGERLQTLLDAAGMTPIELAKKSGVCRDVVLRSLHGGRIMWKSSGRIADALGVSKSAFMMAAPATRPGRPAKDGG